LGKLGKGGISGVTDYGDNRAKAVFEGRGYERQDYGNAIYVPEKEIILIHGDEVPTRQGHVVAIGLHKDVHLKHGRELEDTIKEIEDKGGISVADHIFYKDGIGPYISHKHEIISKLDAIEIFNGEANLWIPGVTPSRANEMAEHFYEAIKKDFPNLGSVVTSDGHSLYEIGSSCMMIPKLKTTCGKGIIESLRAGLKIQRTPEEERKSYYISRIGAFQHMVELAYYLTKDKLTHAPEFKDLFDMDKDKE
jgi:hypothetical protein